MSGTHDPAAPAKAWRTSQRRLARRVIARRRAIARELVREPGWRDKGEIAIAAEAAVRAVEELRPEVAELALVYLDAVDIHAAATLLSRVGTREAAVAMLTQAIRLGREGKVDEMLEAVHGPPVP